MRRTECIAYIIVREISEFLRKLLACFLRLCLFLASEACILKQNDIARLHSCDSLCCCFAGDIIIRNEFHFLAELLGKTCCYRCKGLSLVGPVLDLSKMRAENYLCSLVDQLLNRRKSRNNAGLIGNFAVLERNVEVASHKDSSASRVKIINGFLIECCHMMASFR